MIRAQLLRIERGLAITDVVTATGISHPTITRLEKSEKAGSYDVMVTLAKFFDVQPDDLLTPVGPMQEEAA